MNFVSILPATVSVPVLGSSARFPVHRIYCVGRNYEEHAKEMGFTGREPPFFFLKPADALVKRCPVGFAGASAVFASHAAINGTRATRARRT